MVALGVREQRSKLARSEQAIRANDAKYGRSSVSVNVFNTEKKPKRDTRAEVAREVRAR
jgi:hypothetical protein